MIEQNYDLPCDVSWFQKDLDAICRGRGVILRIAWAPRLYIAKTIDKEGYERNYAKYPMRFIGDFQPWHKGNWFHRKIGLTMVPVGYQKRGGLVPGNVLPTDIPIADIEYVNASLHLFVIERRLPDHIAKQVHEEKRQIAIDNLGFDLFKSFPKEGVWDWCGYISSHYGVMQPWGVEESCCEIAARHQVACEGLYREPNRKDLEAVREELLRWESVPNREDKTSLIEQAARDSTEAIIKHQDDELREILLEAGEEDALDDLAQSRSRIDLGSTPPLHRTAY